LYSKAEELFHRRARGEARYVTPEPSELREGGYVAEARRTLMTGEASQERESQIAYGKELAGQVGGRFFPEEEWKGRQSELSLARWTAHGYRQLAKTPKISVHARLQDALKGVKMPKMSKEKKIKTGTTPEQLRAYGYPEQSQIVPLRQKAKRFILGDPAIREKRKIERAARKEQLNIRKQKLEAIRLASFERGEERGVRTGAYYEGYRKGKGTTGTRGRDTLLDTALQLQTGARGLTSIFTGDADSHLGFTTERPRRPRTRKRTSQSPKRKRRRKTSQDPLDLIF
jgi:hypothetical protein